jgi:lipopolysaccharide biosynthesis regulator YciM
MNAKSLLAAAIAALLLSAPVADVQAQSRELNNPNKGQAEESSRKKKGDDAEQGPTFPNATREDPKPKAGKLQSKMQKLDKLYQSQEFVELIAGAEEVLADPKASPYERARAAYLAGFASMDTEEGYAKAIAYAERAIKEDALPNSVHFQLMQQVAQMNLAEEKFEAAIAAADRFLAETKSPDPKAQAIRGASFYRLDRFAEAIDALKLAIPATGDPEKAVTDMLIDSYLQSERYADAITWAEAAAAKRPADKKMQLNLATVYSQADQPAKAAAVFERLRSSGLLTESNDYEMGYRLLANLEGREKDTIAFINEGLEKGILKPSASVYSLLGQSYYFTEQMGPAIAAWEKGAPLAKDGELFLNLAKANVQEERWAAAKSAAEQALQKGVRRPGEAWIVIAGAARGVGDKAGEIAAYREAAKDPQSRQTATNMLKSLGAK